MTPAEHELSFSFKARYFTLGQLNDSTTSIWFVLHGYGQLAQYFIRKFKPLEDAGIFVVAPEGLSKFYLEDITNRTRTGNNKVGATWMTRENRTRDIINYISYLNEVYHSIVPENFKGEITVLGFSQGAATATRWIIDGQIKFNSLILWGGIFPPDMNFEKGYEVLKGKQVKGVIGKSDPYLNDEKLNEMTAINTQLEISPELITFEGGHEIDSDTLKRLI